MTVEFAQPLSLEDLVDGIAGAFFFADVHLSFAYWKFSVHPCDPEKETKVTK